MPSAPHASLDSKSDMRAYLAIAVTISIWAGYLVVVRAAATADLGIVDVGLLRFIPAAILFAPVWLRRSPIPKGATLLDIVLISGLGGFAFIVFLGAGMQFAPVADSGVFAPSMLPFYVAVLAAIFLNERFSRLQVLGFVFIVLGALAVGGWEALRNSETGNWRGHLLFTAASMSWAIYTVRFRWSKLDPIAVASMITFWSALGFLLLALILPNRLTDLPTDVLVMQIFLHGVLSGFVSTFTYIYALSRIPASKVAASAALVPVLAALGGWFFLAESIDLVKAVGIAIVTCGVALASGLIRARVKP